MNSLKRALASGSVLALALLLPSVSRADEVTCESLGRDRNFCEMDTRGGVHVYKNLSKTDCIEGENWGVSRHGVWVKDGCRAIFVSDSGYGGYGRDDRRRDDYDYGYGRGDRRNDYGRDERYRQPPPPPPPPTPTAFTCPPGTHPSTHRCTKEERRRGCKDYGGPNGMGCSNF